jgi:hypothetical protein
MTSTADFQALGIPHRSFPCRKSSRSFDHHLGSPSLLAILLPLMYVETHQMCCRDYREFALSPWSRTRITHTSWSLGSSSECLRVQVGFVILYGLVYDNAVDATANIVTPGLSLMTGFWYTRDEMPLRQTIWYSVSIAHPVSNISSQSQDL